MSKEYSILQLLIKESEAYSTIESIENMLIEGRSIEHVPIHPLYLALKSLSPEVMSKTLENLTPKQREVCLQVDLWNRDDIDPENFGYWIQSYGMSPNEKIRTEFARSPSFGLYLKGIFNISTFDLEDPQYPDHDNFFLTDDNLLLFEYHHDYPFAESIQQLIRDLYYELGVEDAYAYLFKYTVESFMIEQEKEYERKKDNLRDYGFVDYYDALRLKASFPSVSHINVFIKKKEKLTGQINPVGQNQVLHSGSIVAYKSGLQSINDELLKVSDEKRAKYLQFNFLRMINSSLALNDAIKSGTLAMTRVGNVTRNAMLLGFDYIQDHIRKEHIFEADQSLFDRYEFLDFYKVGHSLYDLVQKRINRTLSSFTIGDGEGFPGRFFSELLDESFEDTPKLMRAGEKAVEIITSQDYFEWDRLVTLFEEMAPFVHKFFSVFSDLKKEGRLHDHYYLNYTVEEIDFEALMVTSFANSVLGHYEEQNAVTKMGLSISEFKNFYSKITKNSKIDESFLMPLLEDFLRRFGMESVAGAVNYFCAILKEQLEGYDIMNLSKDDYRHIGGAILLDQGKVV